MADNNINKYLIAFRKAKISSVAMLEVREIFQTAIRNGAKEETEKKVLDEAFSIFCKEILNG